MSAQDQGVLSLLECLHEAPGDFTAYLRFLDALERAISPDCRVMQGAHASERRPGIVAGPAFGVRQADLGEFLDEFRHPAAAHFPTGSVLPVPAESRFFESRFFDEVLAPAGVCRGPGLGVVIERSDSRVTAALLVLPGTEGWAPKDADRALLEQLAPHVVIARRLLLTLSERQREQEALVSAFDQLVLGVVFTDVAGCISYANRSASELIGHPAGFSEPDAVLDGYTRAWRDLLAGEPRYGAIVPAPDDGRPIQVLDAPLEWDEGDTLAAARFARAFFIADPKQSSGDPIQVLHELFGLTGSETRLAALLMADCSLQEAAGLLGITETTARGVLKSIFAKTETHRQADLLRLLLQGPMGQLRTRRPAPGATKKRQASGRRRRRSSG